MESIRLPRDFIVTIPLTSPTHPKTFSPERPKIAVCSFGTENYREMFDLTVPNKMDYCDRHGYSGSFPLLETWSPFNKIRLVRELLNRNDAVLWNDLDALFMNQDFCIEALLDPTDGQKTLTITRDGYEGVNSGSFLFEKCDEAFAFLDWMLEVEDEVMAHPDPWREQRLLDNFVDRYPYLCRVLPQRMMNSYLRAEYPVYLYPWSDYQEGDWILHFAGLPYQRRIELITQYLPKESLRDRIQKLHDDLQDGSHSWHDVSKRLEAML